MNPRARAWARGLGVALAALAYAVLAHLSNSSAGASSLGVVLAVGPLLAGAVFVGWRSGFRRTAVLGGAAVALLIYRSWPLLAAHYPWVYLLQQVGVYCLLALTFARSLAAGRTPLCTGWAMRVHGPLAAPVVRYTRQVTLLWTLVFALLAVLLVALFALVELPLWSALANFGVFPLIVAVFVAEYAVRSRVLPDMQHAGILAGVRAYLGSGRETAAVRRG